MWFYKVGEDCSYCRTQSEIISPERFLRKLFKTFTVSTGWAGCLLRCASLSAERENALRSRFVRASLRQQSGPPPYYPVGSDASAGTQVWSCYYASLPSARNTMIKLKVSDSRCAPFSRFNYVQLLSARAPRCCSSCVGYCSSVKRLFFNLSVNHTRLMMAK